MNQKFLSKYDSHIKEYYLIKKKNENKDKHHISWKNHGIDQYIQQALQTYLKIKESKK